MTHSSIDHFMTHDPITIERGQPISAARRLMEAHHIRHLPVVHGGKLVGIVSQRDLQRVDHLADLDPTRVPVGEAMTKPVYSVRPEASLHEAAEQMGSRHCGCVVVVDDDQRVVGLLTAGAGLRALSGLAGALPHDA
ncbi:MAG TPA: CBS domain-containing protein [Polyangiaceae bacterium]|nr:CBS domain-containing protein [Polyangiaceae bacterium]